MRLYKCSWVLGVCRARRLCLQSITDEVMDMWEARTRMRTKLSRFIEHGDLEEVKQCVGSILRCDVLFFFFQIMDVLGRVKN